MKVDCGVIRDLMPLCQDGTASPASQAMVEEHLKECASCREYEAREADVVGPTVPVEPVAPENGPDYRPIAKKLRRKHALRILLVVILVAALCAQYLYIAGYRFTAESAARASRYVEEDAAILHTEMIGHTLLYVFDNAANYQTVGVEQKAFLWRPSGVNITAQKYDDQVELLSRVSHSYSDLGISIGFHAILSHDPQAAYVEIGPEHNRIQMELPTGQIVPLPGTGGTHVADENAVVYSTDGRALYRLTFARRGNTILTSELRFFPVEASN